MIKVLIAEDSTTLQQLLVEALGREPDIQIVGLARNGMEAVSMTRQLKPDVITMDVNMPEMDGLQATSLIMSECPTPILIVTGNNGEGEVLHAMTALQAGALALINKPSSLTKEAFEESAWQLIRHIKAMAGMKLVKIRRKERSVTASGSSHATYNPDDIQLKRLTHVAIAASTGGPAALGRILKQLPQSFPLPIFIVQHIAPGFIHGFREWLDSQVQLKVELAQAGQKARAGIIYLAPEDKHIGLNNKGVIELNSGEKIGGFRPSANYLFASLANIVGDTTLALVLTGMGNDGLSGAAALKQKGAMIISQDENSSVVYGMPKAVIDAGLTEQSYSLDEIHHLLLKLNNINTENQA